MALDWSNERYVRLYTRDTATWKLVDWRARTVLLHLLRKVDRAGVLDVGDDGELGLAAVLELPLEEVVEPGIAQLVKRGTVEVAAGGYVIQNFTKAQTAGDPSPAAMKQRRHRAKKLSSSETVTYAIQQGDRGGPVKIGITSDIERRVWQLQNGSPVALVVLHRIPGDLESRLHEACAAFRIRGEWFDGSEEMHAALEAEIGVL